MSCSTPKAFEYKGLNNVKVNNVGFEYLDLSLNLVYFNPNNFKVDLKNLFNCLEFIIENSWSNHNIFYFKFLATSYSIRWIEQENNDYQKHTFSNLFELDGISFEEPSVNFFAFNNPIGACKTCEGFGSIIGLKQEV